MATDASSLLGSPQIAGVRVAAVGVARASARTMGGVAGGVLGDVLGGKIVGVDAIPAQTPQFGRLGFLALTQTELALTTMKGSMIPKPFKVVARVPRSEVISAELGTGVVAPLTIRFAGGKIWQVEVSKLVQKDARALADALHGTATGVAQAD
ncbi:MAG: hypothetical protein ABSB54_07240 [Acidimicrobiales bacterium]